MFCEPHGKHDLLHKNNVPTIKILYKTVLLFDWLYVQCPNCFYFLNESKQGMAVIWIMCLHFSLFFVLEIYFTEKKFAT